MTDTQTPLEWWAGVIDELRVKSRDAMLTIGEYAALELADYAAELEADLAAEKRLSAGRREMYLGSLSRPAALLDAAEAILELDLSLDLPGSVGGFGIEFSAATRDALDALRAAVDAARGEAQND